MELETCKNGVRGGVGVRSEDAPPQHLPGSTMSAVTADFNDNDVTENDLVLQEPKSVAMAIGLSLLWPGLGHFYAGYPVRAAILAVLCLFTFGVLGRFTSAGNSAMLVMRYNRSLATV